MYSSFIVSPGYTVRVHLVQDMTELTISHFGLHTDAKQGEITTVFRYRIGVTVGDVEFFFETPHEQPALTIFDSIAESTDHVMEGEILRVPAKAEVTTISLRRIYSPLRLGDPNQVST